VVFTGLYWRRDQPLLTFLGRRARPVQRGARLEWRLRGSRRCIGMNADGCPWGRTVDGVGRCAACTEADPGRLLAQGRANPAGTFRAYLALFGHGTVKVGVTAERRARDRLLEQGALGHLFLCRGPYMAVRAVEQAVSVRLGVPQGLTWRRKRELWSEETDPHVLVALAARVRPLLGDLEPVGEPVVDDRPCYGPLPLRRRVAEVLQSGDVLAGSMRGAVGTMLLLDEGLVIDTRGLEGWTVMPAEPDERTALAIPPSSELSVRQGSLFSVRG
jgi:Protein of unknown function (DUF2797)